MVWVMAENEADKKLVLVVAVGDGKVEQSGDL